MTTEAPLIGNSGKIWTHWELHCADQKALLCFALVDFAATLLSFNRKKKIYDGDKTLVKTHKTHTATDDHQKHKHEQICPMLLSNIRHHSRLTSFRFIARCTLSVILPFCISLIILWKVDSRETLLMIFVWFHRLW